MENPNKKKFAWLIKNFSSLPSDKLYSAPVLISGFYWDLFTYPKGYKGGDSLVVSLAVTDGQSLPSEWARYIKFRLTIVNQLSHELSIHRETNIWFDRKAPGWGLSGMLPFAKLHDKDGGFLVNDELKIVAEIEALEVIGTLDESKDLLEKTCMDVNGFQVLPSQVESVRGIFERHPDIAVEFRAKNQYLRTACMNFLLSLSEMFSKSVQELSNEDLVEADIALTYLKNAGFKVDCVIETLEPSAMVSEADNKFTWVIKDFSSLQSEEIYSDSFSIGGYKWYLVAYPKGSKVDCLALYLEVADYESAIWMEKEDKFLINQFSKKSSILREATEWFDQKTPSFGFEKILPVAKLHARGELKIVAEVNVLQVIGESDDESEGSQEAVQPMKKTRMNEYGTGSRDLHKETLVGNETVDVNGFHVSTLQHLKSSHINALLGLIETLCKLPEKLSDDDLAEASAAVSYLMQVGFKVDWLEKKLEEVKEKKKKMDTGKAQLQHREEELQKLTKKCSDLKDLVEKEKADLSAANVAFSFYDVV
ncbi:hypothetical protein Bca52824_077664 [Brassica carinata]|uniref:MATH domain-containing protein n=1 Tax=Brassica carinata TaxID=52824 RepID=A0A8X7PWB8_BRACI|nr:hypothetical protein Bca52824_077664 [Brassica carinata]